VLGGNRDTANRKSSSGDDQSSLPVEAGGGGGGMSAEVASMLLPHVPLVSRLLGQQVLIRSSSTIIWLTFDALSIVSLTAL
jgi:hypothetical protein